jgi:hypothetical protein
MDSNIFLQKQKNVKDMSERQKVKYLLEQTKMNKFYDFEKDVQMNLTGKNE